LSKFGKNNVKSDPAQSKKVIRIRDFIAECEFELIIKEHLMAMESEVTQLYDCRLQKMYGKPFAADKTSISS
jgi:hypothetical protein